MNAQDPNHQSVMPLRPLSGGRYRTTEVEAQIRWIQSLRFAELCQRILEKDPAGAPLIKEEALVYLLRDFQRRGCAREAGLIAKTLLDRSFRKIAAWVKRGLPGTADVHREQCVEEIQTQMWVALQSDAAGCEFWEIAFWMCLKRRAMNCLDQSRRTAFAEVHPTFTSDESDQETNLLDLMPDRGIEDVQARIEMQEALNRLPADQRQAVHLFYIESWSQQQIAKQFGVSDRTIRNWLVVAIKSLRSYYGVVS
jgi:RNA polymerase sigma factor (sigma-70 family)